MHAFQVLLAGVPDMTCSRVRSLILKQQCRLTVLQLKHWTLVCVLLLQAAAAAAAMQALHGCAGSSWLLLSATLLVAQPRWNRWYTSSNSMW